MHLRTPALAVSLSISSILTLRAVPAAAQPRPVGDVASASTGQTVVVHIDSPQPVDLEEAVGERGWIAVCTSPCDVAVPSDRSYRIAGAGVRTSKPFRIGAGTRTRLEVQPASSGAHAGAIAVTVIGAAGLVPGAIVSVGVVGGVLLGAIFVCPFVAAFASQPNQSSAYGGCIGDAASYVARGYASPYVWAPAIVGGVALITGITWLASSSPTLVTQPRAPVSPTGLPDAWRTSPAWASAAPAVPLPSPPVAPIIRITF